LQISVACAPKTKVVAHTSPPTHAHLAFKVLYLTVSTEVFDVKQAFLAPQTFEAEARPNNIYEFSPYRKENTTLHH
jgi:hypothetical protein